MANLRIGDLPDLLGTPGPRPILLCGGCGLEGSAHRGDYFYLDPITPVTCGQCGTLLRLVRRRVIYDDVPIEAAREGRRPIK